MNDRKQTQTKLAITVFLGTVIFVIVYKYTLTALSVEGINDIKEHTWTAESIYLDRFWEAWLQRPYLFWHLCVKGFVKFFQMPIEAATSCTCACFAALNYGITVFILNRISFRETKHEGKIIPAVIAAILSVVMPLYMYWFNQNQYVGQFSINTFGNPTHSAVKPFGLLVFIFAVDLILVGKEKEPLFCTGIKIRKWLYALFSIALFLSTFTKPTFMYMLLPAGAVYLLSDFMVALRHKNGSWKKMWSLMWKMAAACIPSIIYLLIEYAAFYVWGGTNADSKVAIYPFLTAWRLCTPNVFKSILLAMMLPIFMIIVDCKYFIGSVEGRLSMIGYAVGTLEFAFFVETGSKLEHFNFAWPMMSGMLLLWVIGAAKLGERTCRMITDRKNNFIVIVGWILLTIYMFSGFYALSPYQYLL